MNPFRWRPLNLGWTFLLYLLFLSILPMLVVGLFANATARTILRNDAIHTTTLLLQSQRQYLELELKQIERLLISLAASTTMEEILVSPRLEDDDDPGQFARVRIISGLNTYLSLPNLVAIDLFTADGRHYRAGPGANESVRQTALTERLFIQATTVSPDVWWSGIESSLVPSVDPAQVIVAAKAITQVNPATLKSEALALLVASYQVDALANHFQAIDLGRNAALQVLDGQGRQVFTTDLGLPGQSNASTLQWMADSVQHTQDGMQNSREKSGQAVDDFVEIEVNGVPSLVRWVGLENNDWQIMSVIPIHSLFGSANVIALTIILTLAVCFVIVAAAALSYNHQVVRPIRQLTERFKALRQGELDTTARIPITGKGEIQELLRWFNTFLNSLEARAQDQKALQESQERYELAVQGANDGLWDWDLLENTIYYSPRWQEISGYTDHSLPNLPQEWFDRVHAEDKAGLQTRLQSHLDGRTPHFEHEHRIRHKDGAYRWVLARGLALHNQEGRAYRMAGSHTDITARKEAEGQLQRDAFYDNLTGLPNRALFLNRLTQAIQRSQLREGYLFAVLFLDMDRFNLINESLGHPMGDQLLIKIGQRLGEHVTRIDTITRLSGDEFALLLDDVTTSEAAVLGARRIQEALTAPFILGTRKTVVTGSMGVVLSTINRQAPELYLQDAEIAMYQAKNQGRNRHVLFERSMRERVLQRHTIESDLRQAMAQNQLSLYYQPIVSLESGQVTGIEALIRWRHPQHGLIFPDIFIPVAEETGLIEPLGNWILAQACHQIGLWRSQDPRYAQLAVNVNLSMRQLMAPELLPYLAQLLQDQDLPANALKLEVTESAVMQNPQAAQGVLAQIREMGIKLYLDDFGTGYSSLSYLQQFGVDGIKIDRSFIQGLTEQQTDSHLVRAILLIGEEMKLDVIAEGVESPDHRSRLLKLGCHLGQGFLFSQALDVQNMQKFLQSNAPNPLPAQPEMHILLAQKSAGFAAHRPGHP